ncbi:MAG: cyclase family protein [Anaerolineae bacterium]|nr:cyclase family protein [Anaerolineae bacterium]
MWREEQIIDITGLIEENMWLDNPLVSPPLIKKIADIDGPTGWEAHQITICTLTGTYLEASAHLFRNGETIDMIAPDRFVRPAAIIQLENSPAGHVFGASDLRNAGALIELGDAVLIATGWDRMWNQPGYVENCPHLHVEAVEWLISQGISLLGADIPNLDDPAQPRQSGVRRLFEAGCLLLGPLVNLRQAILNRYLLVALPLKVRGVCGTPCRAILIDTTV